MATPKEIAREAGIEEIAGFMTKYKEFVWCISSEKDVTAMKKRFPKIAERIVLAGSHDDLRTSRRRI